MSQYVTNMPPKGQSHACPALLEYALRDKFIISIVYYAATFFLGDEKVRKSQWKCNFMQIISIDGDMLCNFSKP